jgi:hypothetical protein
MLLPPVKSGLGHDLADLASSSRGLVGGQIGGGPGVPRLLSPLSANEVMTMMGTAAVRGSLRSWRVASSPEIFWQLDVHQDQVGWGLAGRGHSGSPSTASRRR